MAFALEVFRLRIAMRSCSALSLEFCKSPDIITKINRVSCV